MRTFRCCVQSATKPNPIRITQTSDRQSQLKLMLLAGSAPLTSGTASLKSGILWLHLRLGFPVSDGHLMIVPKSHVPDWFQMTERERREADNLIRVLKKKLSESDKTITGFNVGMNSGVSVMKRAVVNLVILATKSRY